MPQFVLKHEYVPVSSYFIEHHMREANGTFVKVYLYALNLAFEGKNVETSYIAKQLNLLESDVMQALEYWKNAGILRERDGVIEFGDGTQPAQAAGEPEKPAEKPYAMGAVAKAISEDSSLSDMMQFAQNILGKPISPQDAETLYWFYDKLGFSPEVVLMLLEYCVSKGKTNMKYIEKVAVTWSEMGIRELEQVNCFFEDEQKKSGYLYGLKKILGIKDRPLSQSEEQYLMKWRDVCGMSEEMVALAYEYCVMQTAKLSFPYMDKIIERWQKQGIKTVLQAEEDNRAFRAKNAGAPDSFGNGLDHEELERLARKRMNHE